MIRHKNFAFGIILSAIVGLAILASIHTYSAPRRIAILHKSVATTVFWVGEQGSNDNSRIANTASAWDESWQVHYGGVDSPNDRDNYYPAGFTPRENPFYFALPYDDIDDNGQRRASATACPNSSNNKLKHYSWCKNAWIAIQANHKMVYAQWQDVGPYQDNDFSYVFGTNKPRNRVDTSAGLDISPAVRDYLGVSDVSRSNWYFIPRNAVPAGPWNQVITTSLGEKLD